MKKRPNATPSGPAGHSRQAFQGGTYSLMLTAAVLAACLGLVGWTYGERVIQLLNGGQVTIGAGYGTVQMLSLIHI